MSKRKALDRRLSGVPEVQPRALDVETPPQAATRPPQTVPGLFELDVVVDSPEPTASSSAKGDAGPLPEGITTADIRREMAELGAPADVLAIAESFGEDVEALVSRLREITGDDGQSDSLDALLQNGRCCSSVARHRWMPNSALWIA